MLGSLSIELRCGFVAAMLALCCIVSPARVAAQNVEGYVLSVEGSDVIVDLGAVRGVAVGDVVELWRTIELTHPVTRKVVRDRYRIGALKIVQVRDQLAVAVVEGQVKRDPARGDPVVLRRVPEPTKAPAAPALRTTAAPTDAEAARITALFDSLKEAPLEARIRAYIDYVRHNPQSPYAAILREDAVQYHRLLRAQATGPAPQSTTAQLPVTPASPASVPARSGAQPIAPDSFAGPSRAAPGRSLDVGIHLPPPYIGAVLHVRHPGDVGYRPFPMARANGGHYRARIPGDRVRPPEVQYFIEAVDALGRTTPVEGSDDSPLSIVVERDPDATPPTLQTLTTVAVLTDYADYNTLNGKHNDWALQTEGLIGMRFADVGVRALRTGYGVFRGEGGSLHELDDLGLEPRHIGLTYGYLEGEFGIRHNFSLIARAVAGLTEDGVTGGALGMLRIGSDLETNLTIGGEVLGGVGLRSITQLEIREIRRVPLLVRSEVTNQPAGTLIGRRPGTSQLAGELGLRTILQAGYEIIPGLVASARVSSQGRTINHYGFGFGGAVSYTW